MFQARCKAFENEHLTFYFTWLTLVYLVGRWNENVWWNASKSPNISTPTSFSINNFNTAYFAGKKKDFQKAGTRVVTC